MKQKLSHYIVVFNKYFEVSVLITVSIRRMVFIIGLSLFNNILCKSQIIHEVKSVNIF